MWKWLRRCEGLFFSHCWHYDKKISVEIASNGPDCRRTMFEERSVWVCCRCGTNRQHIPSRDTK